MTLKISLLVLSYLVGALPFGVIIARLFYKTDIRQHGSKNTGATNVWRVLGWKPGLSTFILDFLKGFLPVLLAIHFAAEEMDAVLPVLAGVASIIGHNWSLFLKGSGGKGVATSAGVFIALMPEQTLIAILAFVLTKFAYKPIIKLLEERKNRVADDIEKSKVLDSKIKEADSAKNEVLAIARQESEKIIKSSEKNARDIKETILKEASDEVSKIKEEAKKQIGNDREKTMQDMKKELGKLIALSVEKTVGDVMESNTQKKLVEGAVKNIR
jgi:acyl-phosphate glycerol 3-phosphate acyltransferase